MPDRRTLHELDHGAPWGLDDLRVGTALAAVAVVGAAVLALALEVVS